MRSQKTSGHYFPMSQKPEGLPSFPHTASLILKCKCLQGLEGLQEVLPSQGNGPEGLHPKEDVLREASRLLPVFEGTKHVYTMTYLQQPVSFRTLVCLKLCPSQALCLEHHGGWNQVPFAASPQVTLGGGQGNDLSSIYAPGTNVWPAQALSSSYFCS